MRVTFLQAEDATGALAASFAGIATRLAESGHATRLTTVGPTTDLRELLRSVTDGVVAVADPALLVQAANQLPARVGLVHHEHRLAARLPAGTDTEWRRAMQRTDVVLTAQHPTARALAATLGEAAPATRVVPAIAWFGEEPPIRARSALDAPVMMAATDLTSNQAFNPLMKALVRVREQLPEWRLRIFGDGPARHGLARPIQKYGLHDLVELPGTSPCPAVEWSRASIAVHASPTADLPAHLRDAMAAGVPVVAFDDPSGARDFVRHEETGLLVTPGSAAGLASALVRLATDSDLRHRLGRAARDWFEAEARVPDFEQVVEAYREAAAREVAVVPEVRTSPDVQPPPDLTPAEARTAALRAVTAAAGRATEQWFVIPPSGTSAPVVVVPAEARSAFFAALAAAEPAWLVLRTPEVAGLPDGTGLSEAAVQLEGAAVPWIEVGPFPEHAGRPTHLARGADVAVEFWDRTPTGFLVPPRPNGFVPSVAADAATVRTTMDEVEVQTLPLLTQPIVHDRRFPVDVVFTWVDGADAAWEQSRARRLEELTGIAGSRESSGRARFVSRDELRYSMRSVHLFAPWVRTIHLVTAGQHPSWLVDHPKVRLVDHRDILPETALPTFNSHAIEAALHRIPDLAPHWVYFNDDTFLGVSASPASFFTPSGQPYFFPAPTGIGTSDSVEDVRPWMVAAWNNQELLQRQVGAINPTPLQHTPHPHRTAIIEELEGLFPDEFERTRHAPFRSERDLSILSSLAQHYGAATGAGVRRDPTCAYVDLASPNVTALLDRLLQREVEFFCLGDHHDHALPPRRLQEVVSTFLERYFPVAAPWEAADVSA